MQTEEEELESRIQERTAHLEARIQDLERQLAERSHAQPPTASRFYEHVLDELPIQLAVLDLGFRYQYLNALSIADPATRQWVIGKTDIEYCQRRGFAPEIAQQRLTWYRQIVQTGDTLSMEEILHTREGDPRHMLRVGKPIRDHDGVITHLVGYGIDITEQKLAEAETQRLKTLYRDILDNLPLQIAIFDTEGRFLYVNPAGLSDPKTREWVLGKTEIEFLKDTGRDPSLGEKRARYLQQTISERTSVSYIEPFPAKTGETRLHLHAYYPTLNAQGEVVRVLGYRQDITELSQTAEALQRSKARFSRAFMASPAAMSISSLEESKFLDVNERFLYLLGYQREELIDHAALQLNIWAHHAEREALVHVLRQEGQVRDREVTLCTKNGQFRTVLLAAELIDLDGKACILNMIEDVTERRKAEHEREHLIKELEAKNAELERFTYTVSHDLKSPLVTIKGFLGFLENDALTGNIEKLKKDIAHINLAADRMHQLLAELLDLSRIGRLVNPPQEIHLSDLVREALDMLTGQLEGCPIELQIQPDMPIVHADRTRLLEVYQNLIGNAIKYMGNQQAPRIEVGAHQQDGEVVCHVRDNGMGISSRYLEKVFGLFERLNVAVEGTGVGLALVRRIVEVHGGQTWAESDGPGQGSTFYFTLPIHQPEAG